MEQTKATVMQQPGIGHQQALVEALMTQTVKPVRRTIPGGINMLGELDQSGLEQACYNWLRGTKNFEKVSLSLASDPMKFRLQERKLVDFPKDQRHPVWITHPDGRRYLARIMADALKKHQLVMLEARKDGLYMFTDTDKVFAPTRPATAADEGAAIGEAIWNEDWEPYIEFLPSRKSRYAG